MRNTHTVSLETPERQAYIVGQMGKDNIKANVNHYNGLDSCVSEEGIMSEIFWNPYRN
jgi:hypothetical protein